MSAILVWLGGYSTAVTRDCAPEELEHHAKIGATVMLAAGIAMINWAVGSFAFSMGAPSWARAGTAVLAGAIGISVVLIVDRTLLHMIDTSMGGRLWPALVLRAVIIVVVGTFTAEAVLPYLLGAELKAHALGMREASESHRSEDLQKHFQEDKKATAAGDAAIQVQDLKTALATTPGTVIAEQRAARSCWSAYQADYQLVLGAGVEAEEGRSRLEARRARCARDDQRARTDLAAYRTNISNRLETARNIESAAASELQTANNAVSTRVGDAAAIEAVSIVPASSVVLADLVKHNLGAALKMATLLLMLLSLETLPLSTKMLSGRSGLGARIGANRAIQVMAHEGRYMARKGEFLATQAIGASMTEAIIAAVNDPDHQTRIKEYFDAQVASVAPIEGVRHLLHLMEQDHLEIDAFVARYPDLAPLVLALWTQARRDAADILRRTQPSSPFRRSA